MLVRGLQGDADTNHDGLITGTELGSWIQVSPRCSTCTRLRNSARSATRTSIAATSCSPRRPPPVQFQGSGSDADERAPRRSTRRVLRRVLGAGWAETDGSVLDWELRVSRLGIAVCAWRQVDNRAPQAQEMSCDWIGGEADEFQCYLIPEAPT